jgi:phosphatidylcholine synthase
MENAKVAEFVSPKSHLAAWAVHLYTASGLIFALLAAIETFQGPAPDPRFIFLWLAMAVVIDATDGTLARRIDVKRVLPTIDGRKIDDIVDFLTFTFVPLFVMTRMGWVPEPRLLFIIPPLLASVLGFANTGAKDETGGFFRGFPSYWNFVAFYAGIAAPRFGVWPNGIVLLLLAALTVMPVGFIYPNLAPRRWRSALLIGGAMWAAILLAMLPGYPEPPGWLTIASVIYPVFYVVVSFKEWAATKKDGQSRPLPPT